jgi:hypothetical protein
MSHKEKEKLERYISFKEKYRDFELLSKNMKSSIQTILIEKKNQIVSMKEHWAQIRSNYVCPLQFNLKRSLL